MTRTTEARQSGLSTCRFPAMRATYTQTLTCHAIDYLTEGADTTGKCRMRFGIHYDLLAQRLRDLQRIPGERRTTSASERQRRRESEQEGGVVCRFCAQLFLRRHRRAQEPNARARLWSSEETCFIIRPASFPSGRICACGSHNAISQVRTIDPNGPTHHHQHTL
jgi:hypothetical protein